ncbi:hypothetical protein FACS1894204_00460 [Synergistales bacterium]|nr:hypothetical protein FACS1894204_00460 [Synergistales bacterium]
MSFAIKILSRVCAIISIVFILFALCAVFIPLGVVVEPLVRRFGDDIIPGLRVGGVEGSLYSGIALSGVELVSGDESLLEADRLYIHPAWGELLGGNLWLSDLELVGVKADFEKLSLLASRYGKSDSDNPSSVTLRPIHARLRDITVKTPLFSVSVAEGLLDKSGAVHLTADLDDLPIRLDGTVSFSPLAILSSDIKIGAGTATLSGRLAPPFDINGSLNSIKPAEILSLLPAFSESKDPQILAVLSSLKKDSHIGAAIRVSGDAAFADAYIKALGANISVKASADLDARSDEFVQVRGEAANLSAEKISGLLALNVPVTGTDGRVDFRVSLARDMEVSGKIFLRMPRINVAGIDVVKALRLSIERDANGVSVDGTGELFGAKLATAGSFTDITLTAKGLDTALMGRALPALKSMSPSGDIDLIFHIKNHIKGHPTVNAVMKSNALMISGVRLDNISAAAAYLDGGVRLDGFSALLGKTPIKAFGSLTIDGRDFLASRIKLDGSIRGLNTATAPMLRDIKDQFSGFVDATLSTSGSLTNPEVAFTLTSDKNKTAGMPLQKIQLSARYANKRVDIPETAIALPGGELKFRAGIDLGKPSAGPELDMTGSLKLDLAVFTKTAAPDLDAEGNIEADLKISGPASAPVFSGIVRSAKMSVEDFDAADLVLDFSGVSNNINVRRLSARIVDGVIEGDGSISLERRGKLNVNLVSRGVEVRELAAKFGVDSMTGGFLDGTLSFQGTPWRPELLIKITSPLTIKETLVDTLEAKLISPERGKYELEAKAQLGKLPLSIKGQMKREESKWVYEAETGMLDIDQLITSKMPSMNGRFTGQMKARLFGDMPRTRRRRDRQAANAPNARRADQPASATAAVSAPVAAASSPIHILLSSPKLSVYGTEISAISLPMSVLGDRVSADGSARFAGGEVKLSADVKTAERGWKANIQIAGFSLGAAADNFLAGGAIVGSADANISAKGDYGAMMMTFANGDFKSTEGYIHKFKPLNAVVKGGKIPFQEIRGTFFWDGRDVRLNPGTQATAKLGDPLYRYMSVEGPLGIPGKGIGLNFRGRFDVHLLDDVLKAISGLFQATSGSVIGADQLARQAVSKLVGYKEHDFQDVKFQLRGTWDNLQLLNLQIDKSLEGYLPLNRLNKEEEEQKKSDKQFHLKIDIPVGPGSGEDGEVENQFKKQMIDNIFNQFKF